MSGIPVQQSGTVTPGHATQWTTDGVVQDAGPATAGGLSELGITKEGGIALGVNNTSTLNNAPYVQWGVGVSDTGVITIYANSYGGAPAATLEYNINGVTYAFNPVGGGNVTGPSVAVSGDLVSFNGTSGQLVQDSGISGASLVSGPASAVSGHLATFNGTTGKIIEDGGSLGQFALLAGSSGQVFNVANATTATEAVALGQADARYAALAGLSSQVFNVANAVTATEAVALGQFGSLLSASGYQKLPGGWIIQWVQGATFAAGGSDGAPNQFQTVVLPITFPNALLRAWVSTECSAYTYAFDAIWQTVSGSTASAVNVQLQLFGGTNTTGANSWPVVFALGW